MIGSRGSADQVAALKADNARLRRLLDARGVHDGLRHAFRDTVEMLREILRRSHETAESVEDYAAHLVGRLDTLARVRERLDETGSADLHGLVSDELLFHRVREGECAAITGPAVELKSKAAMTLALAVHELATNGIEHGPLAGTSGTVAVSWRADRATDVPVLVLTWKETGAAEATRQARHGFGTMILRDMLEYNLSACTELAYEPDGLRFTLQMPLTPRVGGLVEDRGPTDAPTPLT